MSAELEKKLTREKSKLHHKEKKSAGEEKTAEVQ